MPARKMVTYIIIILALLCPEALHANRNFEYDCKDGTTIAIADYFLVGYNHYNASKMCSNYGETKGEYKLVTQKTKSKVHQFITALHQYFMTEVEDFRIPINVERDPLESGQSCDFATWSQRKYWHWADDGSPVSDEVWSMWYDKEPNANWTCQSKYAFHWIEVKSDMKFIERNVWLTVSREQYMGNVLVVCERKSDKSDKSDKPVQSCSSVAIFFLVVLYVLGFAFLVLTVYMLKRAHGTSNLSNLFPWKRLDKE